MSRKLACLLLVFLFSADFAYGSASSSYDFQPIERKRKRVHFAGDAEEYAPKHYSGHKTSPNVVSQVYADNPSPVAEMLAKETQVVDRLNESEVFINLQRMKSVIQGETQESTPEERELVLNLKRMNEIIHEERRAQAARKRESELQETERYLDKADFEAAVRAVAEGRFDECAYWFSYLDIDLDSRVEYQGKHLTIAEFARDYPRIGINNDTYPF